MGVPYLGGNMTSHPQYVVVRNERGEEMLNTVRQRLEITPAISTGDRAPLVMQVGVFATTIRTSLSKRMRERVCG